MDSEKMWHDKWERELYESFSDLYAIIKTTHMLEKAYVRDLVSPTEYEQECLKLITQFRTLSSSLANIIPSIQHFAEAYKLDCPAALRRLESGVPATVEHSAAVLSSQSSDAAGAAAALVAECVQNFITAMDSLKLNMVAADQVSPLLLDLHVSLLKLGGGLLPQDFEGEVKVKEWMAVLSPMAAADELTEPQVRQLLFDLESSYHTFMVALRNSST